MKTILNPMGKVQNTIAAHRMAIGKTAYMERSRGNQLLNNGIFSEISKRNYRESLEEKTMQMAKMAKELCLLKKKWGHWMDSLHGTMHIS